MFGRERHERQIDKELRFHIERQVADYVASGMTPEEARRRAQLELGGLEQTKESCRDERRGRWIEQFVQDVRYGLRMLGRARAAVAVSVLVIALGVGANMAVFNMVDAFLWHPLALPDLDRIVQILGTEQGRTSSDSFAPADYLDWSADSQTFSAMAAWRQMTGNLSGEGDPEVIRALSVDAGFFPVFGVDPLLGRTFAASDGPDVAVISYGLWVRHFASDAAVLGKTIDYRDHAYRIAGVMPKEFRYLPESDLWVPLALTPEDRANRTNASLSVVGRLKAGAGIEQANADLATRAARLAAEFPQSHAGRGLRALGLAEQINGDSGDGDGKPYMYSLWAAALLVLVIGTANVANLQLARVSLRERELAVRSALGAGRLRLMRQLLTENALLGVLACVSGTLVAYWTIAAMRASVPADLIPFIGGWEQFGVNLRVLAYGLAVAVGAGMLAGIAPALAASARAPGARMQETGRSVSAGRRRHRLRSMFVVVQVSLSIALLTGAVAVAVGAQRIAEPIANTDPQSALTFKLILPMSRYGPPERIQAFQQRLVEATQQMPGVRSAAIVTALPYSGNGYGATYEVEGKPRLAGSRPAFLFQQAVSEQYFEAMRIPLVSGRPFGRSDGADAPPVAIISELMVKQAFGGQDPLGRRIQLRSDTSDSRWLTVVGVVKDVRHSALSIMLPMVYRPYLQAPMRQFDVILRPAGPPMQMVNSVRAAIAKLDPAQAAYDFGTLQDVYYNQTMGETMSARMIGAMGGLALLLAAMGVFSVVASAAVERQKEVAIRMTFGARLASVVWMVVRQGMALTVAGAVLGTAGAVAFCRLLAAAIPVVEVPGAGLFAAVAGFLVAIAIPACYFPARRAALADPAAVLREE